MLVTSIISVRRGPRDYQSINPVLLYIMMALIGQKINLKVQSAKVAPAIIGMKLL